MCPDKIAHPVPVDCLFRKQAGVLESGRRYFEGEVLIRNGPGFRKLLTVFPLASAFAGTMIDCISMVPERLFRIIGPDSLRVRTAQGDAFPLLQFLTISCVQKDVIFPLICS